jgi:hypothetical protein
MKIICVCKTFTGAPFALSSLDSVYNHISKMIYVHGETDWLGRPGNNVREIVEKTADPDNKLIHLSSPAKSTQEQQCDIAVDHILSKGLEFDYIMLLDTDEVMDDAAWPVINLELEANAATKTPVLAYKCRLKTYIKSPFYQITPDVTLQPVLFIHRAAVSPGVIGIRGSSLAPKAALLDKVYLHHFTSVRNSLDLVWAKHETSCGSEKEPIVDKEEWVQTVWNRLPNAIDCLPLAKHKHLWAAVKVVTMADLPKAVYKNPLVLAWQKYSVIIPLKNTRTPTSAELMKNNLPPDFSQRHKLYKFPSYRTRYLRLINSLPDAQPGAPACQEKKTDDLEPIDLSAALKPSKAVAPKNKGSFCVTTIVSGNYQWYIPIFLYSLKMAVRDAEARIYVRGPCILPDVWKKTCIELPDEYKREGYNTAALRFCYSDPELEQFDYCLITDIDIMMQFESIHPVDQHMRSLMKNNLECYDNYISTNGADGKRVPGVHFVTKAWWARTAAARDRHRAVLREEEIKEYDYDERMLYRIIHESGLPEPPKLPNLWAHHGVHLGDWRRDVESKRFKKTRMQADNYLWIKTLLSDRAFLSVMKGCSAQLPIIGKIFERFSKLYYL